LKNISASNEFLHGCDEEIVFLPSLGETCANTFGSNRFGILISICFIYLDGAKIKFNCVMICILTKWDSFFLLMCFCHLFKQFLDTSSILRECGWVVQYKWKRGS
jgi:hypothetical protein